MDFESWCPVCDRQILPKRYLVPVNPPPPPAPAPPPSSPQSPPPKNNAADPPHVRRSKGGTIRARPGGLVHGTGRVKPNGTLKRSDSGSKKSSAAELAPLAPAGPVKTRLVIDQGPLPLYCSDECKVADMQHSYGAFPIDHNPARAHTPVPHNSLSTAGSETESDSTGSSSVDSASSLNPQSPLSGDESPSIKTLAALYNFPPLPPPANIYPEESSSSDSDYPHEYASGIMMAGRRLEAMCPKPVKKAVYGQYPPEPRKAVRGWNDGSNEWRAAVYSFATPKRPDSPQSDKPAAYQSFAASPHRSRGVYSTLGESVESAPAPRTTTSLPPSTRSTENEELMNKYSMSFSRRSESRIHMFSSSPSSAHSLPSTAPPRRERSLLLPGAEGKLLVPNVKMRVHGGSSASLSSTESWRSSARSPLSRYGSDLSEEDTMTQGNSAASLPTTKRPTVETRSWSYDNVKTYPVMPLPSKKEKRVETQLVDGVEREVEVEVEVEQPRKRLFLFAGKQQPLRT